MGNTIVYRKKVLINIIAMIRMCLRNIVLKMSVNLHKKIKEKKHQNNKITYKLHKERVKVNEFYMIFYICIFDELQFYVFFLKNE